jgi:DNA-binding NarL/FixJ family response regulator
MLPIRVLLVDDHPLFRDGIASLLATRGINVVGEAGDGLEALDKARALKPDIILMDINMPRLGGLEATRLLKTAMPNLKIIILTASEEDNDLFEAIKSGAQGYLSKSLEAGVFFELLDGVSRGEAPLTKILATKILDEFARRSAPSNLATPETADALTEREQDVLRLVSDGRTNREIADALILSENTIKYHLKNILAKLHLRNRSEAVAYALRSGLIQPLEGSS